MERLHHTVSTLQLELTKRFDLDVSFVWDRTRNPVQESSGAVPQQDDFRLKLSLGMRFLPDLNDNETPVSSATAWMNSAVCTLTRFDADALRDKSRIAVRHRN